MEKMTFPVRGMTCAACARNVENILKMEEGVNNATVNYAAHQVTVETNNALDFKVLQDAVQSIGYDLVEKTDITVEKAAAEKQLKKIRNKLVVAAIFSVPLFVLAMFFMLLPNGNYIQFLLVLPVIFYSGRHYYTSAYKKLLKWQFNMDTLIAMGTGAAFIYSVVATFFPAVFQETSMAHHVYFESAAVIITLILLGKYFEERAKSSTNKAIEKLMELQPATVVRLNNGADEVVPIEAVMKGDVIRIFPGANIPLDGLVAEGESFVDESMLTGEPLAISKQKGDTLTGGTVNNGEAMLMQVVNVGSNTVLASIIKQVQEAQGSKAPVQKLADKISGVFVPIVVLIALISASIWYFFGPEPSGIYAFTVAITVLIIACPCALGLATPTAITVGVGKGAALGILIKDAETFEKMCRVEVLFVDKTGTLTEGKPTVTKAFFVDGLDKNLKGALLSAEKNSEHPLAKTIVKWLDKENAPQKVTEVKEISGQGISFIYNEETYFFGRPGWKNATLGDWAKSNISELEEANQTILELSNGSEVLAIIGLNDVLKTNANQAVSDLNALGVEVIILSGDAQAPVKAVANGLNISTFHAALTPAKKLEIVASYMAKGKTVAMAGDGINDAPALAKADVGIAMGTGTDVAIGSAGITLLHGDISRIVQAMDLSKQTNKTIKQNLFWAFFYNIVAIPVAAGALYPVFGFLLNPMIAGGAMAFSSISVVLNSLRLKARVIG